MISDCILDDIPPQMKTLNMVIPILMHFCLKLEHFKLHKAAHHPMKCDIIYDIKLFPISQDIPSQIFDVIQSDVALQNRVH